MDADRFARARLQFTLALSAAYWALLLWQHFHGGVPGHHFLARDDMPYFTNWWGALLLPALTWFLTGRLQARLATHGADDAAANTTLRTMMLDFLVALLYGALLATAFATDHADVSSLLFQALFVLALLLPIFRAEYVLGFIFGLTLTFGPVLPLIISSVLALVSIVLHLTVRRGFAWLMSRLMPDQPRR